MSQKKKTEMGYIQKPIQKTCSNCSFFSSDFIETQYGYKEEKNIHCTIGKFVVKKSATCNIHKFKI